MAGVPGQGYVLSSAMPGRRQQRHRPSTFCTNTNPWSTSSETAAKMSVCPAGGNIDSPRHAPDCCPRRKSPNRTRGPSVRRPPPRTAPRKPSLKRFAPFLGLSLDAGQESLAMLPMLMGDVVDKRAKRSMHGSRASPGAPSDHYTFTRRRRVISALQTAGRSVCSRLTLSMNFWQASTSRSRARRGLNRSALVLDSPREIKLIIV